MNAVSPGLHRLEQHTKSNPSANGFNAIDRVLACSPSSLSTLFGRHIATLDRGETCLDGKYQVLLPGVPIFPTRLLPLLLARWRDWNAIVTLEPATVQTKLANLNLVKMENGSSSSWRWWLPVNPQHFPIHTRPVNTQRAYRVGL